MICIIVKRLTANYMRCHRLNIMVEDIDPHIIQAYKIKLEREADCDETVCAI